MTQPSRSLLVLDASAAVAWLSDAEQRGQWARDQLRDRDLAAPDLLLYETGNVLRRIALTGAATWAEAQLMHQELLSTRIWLVSYGRLSRRAWELAPNLTIYDAAYVALAELLEAPLLTLDQRLTRAPGVECEVLAYAGA